MRQEASKGGEGYFVARKYGQGAEYKGVALLVLGYCISTFIEAHGDFAAWLTPFRIRMMYVLGVMAACCYVLGYFMLRARVVFDEEGVWQQGMISPLRLIRWNDITEVRASGIGRRGGPYLPMGLVILHGGGKCRISLDAFDRPIPALRILRSRIPRHSEFDQELENLMRKFEEK
jgi:hypothetical protein